MKTKYDIGQMVNIPMEICEVSISALGTIYSLRPTPNIDALDILKRFEEDIETEDSVPTEDYEREVNRLKDEINRYKELYQFEHEQVQKVKSLLETMKSHLPEKNTYDWRQP